MGKKEIYYSLLEKAIRKNDIEEVKNLIAQGVNVNEADPFIQSTPLMQASLWGHVKIIKLLLAAGADVHAKNALGDTALIDANNKQTAQLLLNAGAKTTPQISFILACRFGESEQVRKALRKGMNPNAKNTQGETPLMHACNKKIATILIEAGANVNETNGLGWTPLMWAGALGRTSAVRALLDAGAEVNKQASDKETALFNAHNAQISKMLIEAGAKVNVKDQYLRTPLHRARNGKIAHVLIESGADLNVKDWKKRTPLIRAAISKGIDLAKVLLAASADITAKDEQGLTALMWGKKNKKYKMVKLLQEAGAKA